MFKGSYKLKAKKKASCKSGFSLVEVLVAMFIFSLVGVMLAGSFSGFLKSYVSAKKAQKSSESALNAINLMAKTIRSSTLAGVPSSPTILMFDNSQGAQGTCVSFQYAAGKIQVAVGDGITAANVSECDLATMGSFSDLTPEGAVADLNFSGELSDSTATPPTIGKVQISMKVQEKVSTHLQTTVSLRN